MSDRYRAIEDVGFEHRYWKQLSADLATVPGRIRKIDRLTRSSAIRNELHGILDTLEAANELIRGRRKVLEARLGEIEEDTLS